MSSLYGMNPLNFTHVDIYRWAERRNILVPVSFNTPELKEVFLKILSNMPQTSFRKLSEIEEKTRFSHALKEMTKHFPSSGLSDTTFLAINVAGTVFFAVLSIIQMRASL